MINHINTTIIIRKNDDSSWSSSKHLSTGSTILFDNCDHELKAANFPITPDETVERFFVKNEFLVKRQCLRKKANIQKME